MESIHTNKSQRSPLSPVYDGEKNKRYDRQLRLWGDQGQYRIEVSNVCLINANALGTEILKNLVLPGIGSFTIIDPSKISTDDDNNFFISKDSLGQSRAKVTTNLLVEMNPEVRGNYIEDSIENILENQKESESSFFSAFSAVVVSNLYNEKILVKLSELLWSLNIPLLICNSIGFIGYSQLQIREHCITESHPDYNLEDLRLDNPFAELKDFLESNSDFENLSSESLSHVPYIVIIYKYLKEWQKKFSKPDTCLPVNSKEKTELKRLIENQRDHFRNKLADGKHLVELENFDEAIKAVNQVLVKSDYVPEKTQEILSELDRMDEEPSINKQFWLLVKGLKLFMNANDKCLPLKGRIPDMTSDSTRYIQLQNIYKKKSREDAESINTIIQNYFNEHSERFEEISDSFLRSFCANSHCLRLIRTSQLSKELKLEDTSAKIRDKINYLCMDGDCDSNELIYYLMIRSVFKFYTENNRLPGNEQMENDILLLKNCFKNLLKDIDCNNLSKDDYVHEFCRYGGCELHSVSAFLAGAIAQEVIKLITGQYVPFNNILIYNAISSTTSTFSFN